MWIAYFCGFDGLAILRRLKKQSYNETDKQDESILTDLPECVKTADKAVVTNIKVLTPEEILELKSDSDIVQACTATLNEIVITVLHDNENTILSSLKVEKEMKRPEIVSTVRDKIVTVFDNKRVHHSHDNSLTGKLMNSAENQVLHAGGTDSTLFLVEEKKLKMIKVIPEISLPIEICVDFCVSEISCGKEHALILTNSGDVYSCGGGSRGQLGLGHVETREQPCLVEDLTGVRMKCVGAGGWHSMAISELGDLYVWGWNESGQLGLPCRNISTQSPPAEERHRYQLASPEPADKATGTWFTCVHLENTVSGQCEAHIQRVGPIQVQSEPTILDFGEDVTLVKVAGGARHSAVVTGEGHLLTTGWNDYGQLCHEDVLSRDYFQSVDYFLQHRRTVKGVFCGPWSTIVLCQNYLRREPSGDRNRSVISDHCFCTD
ncbi:RCC1 domain-containing protein 1-like isoform X1 [Crassostrea angulata]|uniref:RCC1 domain-containing protein 1-like isoform X1 n=2 Tax=Magallana angulata TaxID=2784310 RepID=UPI0022B207C1|nr:RCC1 domain-containing protein 1-like isoform X1 [Crassostrea angulata]